MPPLEGSRDSLVTNGPTRIGNRIVVTYAASLKSSGTVNPCDNTVAPAAVQYAISDVVCGSADHEHVADDGLGDAVDCDDQK